MVDSENPYASPATAPLVEAESVVTPSEVEEIRRRYLKHEGAIRAVGLCCYMFGTLWVLSALMIVSGSLLAFGAGIAIGPGNYGFLLVYLNLAVLAFILGTGLRRLDRRFRVPVIIVSALGLLYAPTTVIGACALYLMFSSKTTMVLSPYYQDVIAQTPHIECRISGILWILLAVVLAAGTSVGLLLWLG